VEEQAKEMLDDLNANCLEVVLIPSHDPDCAMRGGMIRAVQYQNANWYRQFCKEHPSNRKWQNRKGRTLIKRNWTIKGLTDLIEGRNGTIYTQRLKSFMLRNPEL
jgi:hypothetical protein